MPHSLLFALSLLGVALMQSALAEEAAPATDGPTAQVITLDYKFQPPEITVQAGTTVIWENQESRQYHSVWFKEAGEEPGQYFFPGETVQRTFDQPGAYPYVCEPHEDRGMKGVVHVVE